jgi:LysM repeat protein
MSPVLAHLPATPAATPQTAIVQKSKPAPYGWTTYAVRPGDTLGAIALRHRTSEGVLISRNRLRNHGHLLQIGQRLQVPRTAAMARAAAAAARAAKVRAAKARAAAIARSTHVVRSGDTLGGIAARRGVSLASLLKANRLRLTSTIYVGQRLRVPGGRAQAAAPARRTTAARPTARYRVRSGDTLGAIALRTRTPLPSLLSMNRLSMRSTIHPGQVLRIRGTASSSRSSAPAVARRAYTVRSGDTLSAIAVRFGTTQAAIMKASRLRNAHLVYVGQRLSIPVRRSAVRFSSNTFEGRTYPSSVVAAAARNRAHLRSVSVPSRAQTRALIVATARRHGVDPRLALAVSWQESGWNQRQVSVANAIGAMQVIPSSGQWASDMVGRRLNLLNTRDNITAGVVILRSLTRSAKNLDQAIAGYYQGLYSVQKNGMYADTKRYVASIKAHRARM